MELFYERKNLFSKLLDIIKNQSKRNRVFCITGPTGIGKSVFATELFQKVLTDIKPNIYNKILRIPAYSKKVRDISTISSSLDKLCRCKDKNRQCLKRRFSTTTRSNTDPIRLYCHGLV